MSFKKLLLDLWSILAPIYYACTRLCYVKKEDGKPCIFRVRLMNYSGHPVILADGTTIKRNDLLLKIHLHNVRLLKEMQTLANDYRRGYFLYKQVQESLPYLANYVKHHFHSQQIKGIIGITMLQAEGLIERLGFEQHAIKNKVYKITKQIIQYPIYLLSHSHKYRLRQSRAELHYLIMSRKTLLEKYDRTEEDS